MSSDWECIVIGGGAAGLGAALQLGRARRRTLVLDAGGQSNRPAARIGGLLAQEGTSPAELYATAREQVAGYGVAIRDVAVDDARRDGDGFVVTAGGEALRTRAIVLATGMDYDVPDLPGVREHWGGDVFHCPFCHGWEVRDEPLVACAPGEIAEHMRELLLGWSSDVTAVDPADVTGLRTEDGRVRAVELRDGSEVPCAAVMVHAPLRPRTDLPERLGVEVGESGFVTVDALGRASVPGVYAGGDLAGVAPSVAIALGSGTLAGASAVRELLVGRLEPAQG